MKTLEENIAQAISDFNGVENALKSSGVDVPAGTDTSEYGNLVSKVYDAGVEAGKAQGEKAMWDAITANNTRTAWSGAFRYYDCEYLRPPYVIAPTQGSIANMFSDNKSLKTVERKHFDFSNYVPAQTLTTTAWYQTFINCSALEKIVDDLGMEAGGYQFTFSGCSSLETIAVWRVQEDTQFNRPFNNCGALKNITVEGTIGQSISFVNSSLLTIDSLISIITHLADYYGTENEGVYSLTLNGATKAFLDEQGATSPSGTTWRDYISEKGWNLE